MFDSGNFDGRAETLLQGGSPSASPWTSFRALACLGFHLGELVCSRSPSHEKAYSRTENGPPSLTRCDSWHRDSKRTVHQITQSSREWNEVKNQNLVSTNLISAFSASPQYFPPPGYDGSSSLVVCAPSPPAVPFFSLSCLGTSPGIPCPISGAFCPRILSPVPS